MDPERLHGKRIVLFRTDRIGDLILSLPVVEALKSRLPKTRIDMVTAPATACLAALQPGLERIFPHVYRGPAGLAALARTLAANEYTLAVHLYPRPLQALAAFLARIPLRVGTAYRAYSVFFNRRVPVHRKTMTQHEGDLNLKLLESMGIRPGKPAAGICVPEAARQRVRNVLGREPAHAGGRPFVVLHPGSGGSSLRWPVEHFTALGRGLAASGWPLVLTGTETDRPLVDTVYRSLGQDRATNLCGHLDLPHLAALLLESALTVSNSTGPLHLADALGRKVIGLYSRHLYDSPIRWGPWHQPENAFTPAGGPCRHCPRERCNEYHCMATIRPEAVLERAHALILQGGATGLFMGPAPTGEGTP